MGATRATRVTRVTRAIRGMRDMLWLRRVFQSRDWSFQNKCTSVTCITYDLVVPEEGRGDELVGLGNQVFQPLVEGHPQQHLVEARARLRAQPQVRGEDVGHQLLERGQLVGPRNE